MNIRSGLRPLVYLALALAPALTGCDNPRAVGDVDNIMVAAPDSVWNLLRDSLVSALEPTAFTVRNERIFDVASVDPRSSEWSNLRLLRQVLVIGTPEDPWVAEALEEAGADPPTQPTVLQARDVWAQGQLVTVVALPTGASATEALALVPRLSSIFLEQYEEYARARMFASGADSALADSLAGSAGFSLLVPEVYYYAEVSPGLLVFRNDFPNPSQLIRSIQVTSAPEGEVEFTPQAAREWRSRVVSGLTQPPHVTDSTIAATREIQLHGRPALEIQGVWANPPGEWPAAGPYLTRLVRCPGRAFLVDAWLYAPGKSKYEYMVQLATILDSFRCAG